MQVRTNCIFLKIDVYAIVHFCCVMPFLKHAGHAACGLKLFVDEDKTKRYRIMKEIIREEYDS